MDDSDLVIAIVSEGLTDAGWATTVAMNGAEALEAFVASRPEVVVCDLHMPDMGGFEVMDRMRAIDPEVPVIMHSGDSDLSAVLGAVRRGAFDYIVKAAENVEPMLAALERALEHGRIKVENRRLGEELKGRVAELQREVQERREAERALATARDQALAASRTKSAFLANMSHEFRTPLNAIIGYAELLEEEAEDRHDALMQSDLKRILGSSRHLLALINDLLDVAKIEAGAMSVHLEVFDVVALCEDLANTLMPIASARRNTLTARPETPVRTIVSDRHKLSQCLMNLVGNACKFTEGGTVTLHVGHELTAGRDWIRFDVQDTGIGIGPQQVGRVFEEFTQADASTTRQYGGTGLGLTISRRLARLLGGDLSVTSELGKGSTFTLRVPDSRVVYPVPTRDPNDEGAMSVLVIADDARIRSALQDYLMAAAYPTAAVADIDRGVKVAGATRPSVVVLAGLGERMLNALSALRSDNKLAETMIVLVHPSTDHQSGLVLGVSDIVSSPVKGPGFTQALSTFHPVGSRPAALIVNRDPETTALARESLRAEWEVLHAGDVETALAAVEAASLAVVVVDLATPEAVGFDVVEALRAQPVRRTLPILAYTSAAPSPDALASLERHVDTALQAPGRSLQLLNDVHRAIHAHFTEGVER